MVRSVSAGLLVATALVAVPVSAQDADFLFKRPQVTVGFFGGWALPQESSDIFDLTRSEFTVDNGAFDAFAIRGEVAYRATEQVDISLDLGFSKKSVDSESRDFIGADDLPIFQTTEFQRTPVALNAKYYFSPRGREISQFSWIPASVSPYLGGGVGVMAYEFRQFGEFVDFETLDIFFDSFVSEGTAPLLQLLGGVDVSLSPRFVFSADARYLWASAEMDELRSDGGSIFPVFEGFDDIDLSGFQLSAGVRVRL